MQLSANAFSVLKHMFRMAQAACAVFRPANESRKLMNSPFRIELTNNRFRRRAVCMLFHHEMRVAKRGDLRQMGYTQYLMIARNRAHLFTNRLRHSA